MKPGFYWARCEGYTDWGLVEVSYKHHKRSREEFGWPDTLEVYGMGWDCPDSIESYAEYVETNLVDLDGHPYKGNDE